MKLKYTGATPLTIRNLDEHRPAVTLAQGETLEIDSARGKELLANYPDTFKEVKGSTKEESANG